MFACILYKVFFLCLFFVFLAPLIGYGGNFPNGAQGSLSPAPVIFTVGSPPDGTATTQAARTRLFSGKSLPVLLIPVLVPNEEKFYVSARWRFLVGCYGQHLHLFSLVYMSMVINFLLSFTCWLSLCSNTHYSFFPFSHFSWIFKFSKLSWLIHWQTCCGWRRR